MSTDIKKSNTMQHSSEQITAGIDIGSNSIRMLIASVADSKIIRQIATFRDSTRLATGVKQSGNLTLTAIDKSITLLKKYKTLLDSYGITKIKVVATSAVREANNKAIFLTLAKEIGLNVEIISGDDEARFVYLGVSSVIDFHDDSILFDIGGGSTEFIEIRDKLIVSVNSYKLGVVKLVDEFNIKSDDSNCVRKCQMYVNNFINSEVTLPKNIKTLVATAGTATSIAAIHQTLKEYSADLINNYKLELPYIEELYQRLISTPLAERSKIIGLEKGREDLIIPGTQILIAVMKRLKINEIKVADYGLREAAAILAAD